jgi:hypothetical protein
VNKPALDAAAREAVMTVNPEVAVHDAIAQATYYDTRYVTEQGARDQMRAFIFETVNSVITATRRALEEM